MTQSNNILQELRELGSSLASQPASNVYQVPTGYFDGLADQVMRSIRILVSAKAADEIRLLSPALDNISRKPPYSIPADYFQELENSIHAITHSSATSQDASEELKQISPLLSGLKKEMPYSIPQGYFDQIPAPVRKQGRVISMPVRRAMRYAVAAVLVGLVALTGIIVVNRNSDPEKVLAKIEKKATKQIDKTSDKELIEFIQYTEDASQDLAVNDRREDLNEFLKDVPATELQQFLDEIADPEN